ncbi:hypothetical protein [Flavobacterium sp.]|jgi:hypothetical protein|uniref:hypothetical protein n=1 Tax=Flavobacterium sp. TaxID=239 RepID=UPI0037BEBBC1
MKKVLSVMAVAAFLFAANVNAQEQKPKEEKKECSKKEMKSCDKEKKAGCCAGKKAAEKKS